MKAMSSFNLWILDVVYKLGLYYTDKVERMKWCMESILQITQICRKILHIYAIFGSFHDQNHR